uniref:ATP synthase F0 subunit 8 n=1 Tax=Yanocephalus yanonis TaxID=317752 RepID=A0A343KJ47_9HEMI|nr:ATP synthase F0 subunit 8 [Yanocephalus yanonis]ATG83152.1 ATP synthase F0 subunit 8 [Yanocephalus yanonis]
MPQMAPMWWTSILMITLMMMMLSMMFMYFLTSKKVEISLKTNKNQLNWKW